MGCMLKVSCQAGVAGAPAAGGRPPSAPAARPPAAGRPPPVRCMDERQSKAKILQVSAPVSGGLRKQLGADGMHCLPCPSCKPRHDRWERGAARTAVARGAGREPPLQPAVQDPPPRRESTPGSCHAGINARRGAGARGRAHVLAAAAAPPSPCAAPRAGAPGAQCPCLQLACTQWAGGGPAALQAAPSRTCGPRPVLPEMRMLPCLAKAAQTVRCLARLCATHVCLPKWNL